jgi:hypothetical protein
MARSCQELVPPAVKIRPAGSAGSLLVPESESPTVPQGDFPSHNTDASRFIGLPWVLLDFAGSRNPLTENPRVGVSVPPLATNQIR